MATAFAEETKKEVKKDVTSLRSALDWLDTQGDVMTTDVEVDPDLEITGVQKHLDGGPVVLCLKLKTSKWLHEGEKTLQNGVQLDLHKLF